MSEMSPKLEAGLSMVADAREGEWQQCAPVLSKLLGNILANPGEPKYRTIRTTNAKIASCLATRGARAVLVGVGFVEAGEQLTLPDDAPTTAVQAGLDGLEALNAQRLRTAQDEKEAEIARRKEEAEKENEERKRMRSGIADGEAHALARDLTHT